MTFVIGIDVGTQGARVVACDPQGVVQAQATEPFALTARPELPPRWAEQEPEMWWAAVTACLHRVIADLRRQGQPLEAISALAVTSTSGTILPIDARGKPLRPAMMYNDSRAQAEAEEVQAAGSELAAALGYRFNASFALAKILWLRHHEAELFEAAHRFIHAADFIVGRLTGEFGMTNFSDSLKTGYDVQQERWPDFIETKLAIPRERLPAVVRPGPVIAHTSPLCAEATGLPPGIPVLAGMTDGCTSQISTGAVAPGDWNSTLGTTLVVKGVTEQILLDPKGRIYSHRHPAGYWLPGGASNTGGEAVALRFPQEKWTEFNAQVLDIAPTDTVIYPLARLGERFPFAKPTAEGFMLDLSSGAISPYPPPPAGGRASESAHLRLLASDYTAHLEGVAYVERLAYEVLAGLGAEIGDTLYSAGGATRSRAWSQLRADILGRTLVRPEVTGGAMGAAIIAAAGTWYDGLVSAARAMVRLVEQIEPRPFLAGAYETRYQRFKEVCAARGYLE
ncbi:MAG: FGGY-family carbohydrate kinase [Anaerolineae bacterium]|nr:FGGY-family carbohydrate kinase [Anaerolineae bacterium]